MRKIVFFLVIISSLSLFAEKSVLRIRTVDSDLLQQFEAQGIDIAAVHFDYLDIVIKNEEIPYYKTEYPNAEIVQTEQQLKHNLTQARPLNGYHSYDEVYDILTEYATNYPEICQLTDIGDSWGKIYAESDSYYEPYDQEIYAIKFSDNVTIDEDEPEYYLCGAHHAREPISTEVVLKVMETLIQGYEENDPEMMHYINNKEIWFIPIVNPNGHKVVYDQDDVWWRKNIRDNNNNGFLDTDSWGYGNDGVDPNRNYGFHWGDVGTTDDNYSPVYNGETPFSEPETQAVRDFLQNRNILAGISYHSYSELVLYPYGHLSGAQAPDHIALSTLGELLASQIPKLSSPGYYTPANGWELYPAMGGTDDWAYGELGIFHYTVELGVEFIPNATDVEQIKNDNLDAAFSLFERDEYRTLTGCVTDSETGEPIQAEIFIEEIDANPDYERISYKSEAEYGRYYRFLHNGTFTVTYRAYGYEDFTTEISIENDSNLVYNATLQPVASENFNIIVLDESENPMQNVQITIENKPQEVLFVTDENGQATITNLPAGIHTFLLNALELEYPETAISIDSTTLDSYTFTWFTPTVFEDFESESLDNWLTYGSWFTTFHTNSNQLSVDFSNSYAQASIISEPFMIEENCNYNYLTVDIETMFSSDYGGRLLFLILEIDDEDIYIYGFGGSKSYENYLVDLSSWKGKEARVKFLVTNSDPGNGTCYIDNITLHQNQIIVQNDAIEVAKIASLEQNYPNPFSIQKNMRSQGTKINFELFMQQPISLSIFNLRGQKIKTLVKKNLSTGKHSYSWYGKNNAGMNVSSGIYFYQLKTSNETISKKLMIIR